MEHEVSCGPVAELDSTERVSRACASPPHLLIVAADGTWTSRPLPAGGTLTIGRGVEVDVRVNEQAVSRRHARLEVTSTTELRLVDLGSANGTLVGEKFVHDASVTVWPGEPILIGRTVLAVHAPQPERADDEDPPPPLQPGFALADIEARIGKVAPTLINVLLLGETGVGKDVVAERIHRQSPRAAGPLVRL